MPSAVRVPEGAPLDRHYQVARKRRQAVELEANVPAAHDSPRLEAEARHRAPAVSRLPQAHEGSDVQEQEGQITLPIGSISNGGCSRSLEDLV